MPTNTTRAATTRNTTPPETSSATSASEPSGQPPASSHIVSTSTSPANPPAVPPPPNKENDENIVARLIAPALPAFRDVYAAAEPPPVEELGAGWQGVVFPVLQIITLLIVFFGGYRLVVSQCQWNMAQGHDATWCISSVIGLFLAVWGLAMYVIPGLARGKWGFWIGATIVVVSTSWGIVMVTHAYLPDESCAYLTPYVSVGCGLVFGVVSAGLYIVLTHKRPRRAFLLDPNTRHHRSYGSTAVGPNVRDHSDGSDYTGGIFLQISKFRSRLEIRTCTKVNLLITPVSSQIVQPESPRAYVWQAQTLRLEVPQSPILVYKYLSYAFYVFSGEPGCATESSNNDFGIVPEGQKTPSQLNFQSTGSFDEITGEINEAAPSRYNDSLGNEKFAGAPRDYNWLKSQGALLRIGRHDIEVLLEFVNDVVGGVSETQIFDHKSWDVATWSHPCRDEGPGAEAEANKRAVIFQKRIGCLAARWLTRQFGFGGRVVEAIDRSSRVVPAPTASYNISYRRPKGTHVSPRPPGHVWGAMPDTFDDHEAHGPESGLSNGATFGADSNIRDGATDTSLCGPIYLEEMPEEGGNKLSWNLEVNTKR
ncbi:hypothetical protein BU15DRAFT_59227 [Melanogaster broomeanus]|nr:hypothetical protein BU15DRAFT_59227 [Melanogaster broomeanus]